MDSDGNVVTSDKIDLLELVDFALTKLVGGCATSKHASTENQTKNPIKGEEYAVTLTLASPASRSNDCGLAAIDHINGVCGTDYAEYRRLNNIPRTAKLSIEDLDAYCDAAGLSRCVVLTQETILHFTPDQYDSCGTNLIWLDKDHYRPVVDCAFKELKEVHREVLIWDLETIVTTGGKIVDSICHVRTGTERHGYKFSKFERTAEKSACRQFYEWIVAESARHKAYRCYAHFGSGFDALLLLAAITPEETRNHVKFFHKGSKLIKLDIKQSVFFDTAQFMPSSLKKLGADFKVKHAKMTDDIVFQDGAGITHHVTSTELCFWQPDITDELRALKRKPDAKTRFYEHTDPMEFMTYREAHPQFWAAYSEYCRVDVESLGEVVDKFHSITDDLLVTINKGNRHILRKCTWTLSSTIGAMCKKIFAYLNKDNNAMDFLKRFTYGQGKLARSVDPAKYEFILKFVRGGVSYCRGAAEYLNGVLGVDIVSMYPYSGLHAQVPTGWSRWVTDYDETAHGYWHVRDVDFGDNTEKFRLVADKPADGSSLKWRTKTIAEAHLTSYNLLYLRNECPNMTFSVVRGLVSKQDMSMSAFFGAYIDGFFAEKQRQDVLKNAKDELYNESVRTATKLFLNSVFGKTLERTDLYTSTRFASPKNMATSSARLNGVPVVETARPQYNDLLPLGVAIYGHSKQHLWEYMKCLPNGPEDALAVETDGVYFEADKWDEFARNLAAHPDPHVKLGAHLGGLDQDKKADKAVFAGKKLYALATGDKERVVWKGAPQSTINADGTRVSLVSYDKVRSLALGTSQTVHYSTMKRTLIGEGGPSLTNKFVSRTFRI